MRRKPHLKAATPEPADPSPGAGEEADPTAAGPEPGAPSAANGSGVGIHAAGTVAEPTDQAIERLEREADELKREIEEWKDRALRAAADFDNYRKRAIRERDEASGRGQAQMLLRVLDVIDDLARVAHLEPAQTTAEALHEGVGLVERKLLKALEDAGLERVDPAGQPFDPYAHEAVTALPAPTPEADHTVSVVYQPGYRFRGTMLRPARVAVLQWTPPAAGEAAP